MLPYAWMDDRLLSLDAVRLPPGDLGLHRGYAVFDFFRFREGRPLFIGDYLDRLFQSAAYMRFPIAFDRETMHEMALKLLRKNGQRDMGVRITLTGGGADDGITPGRPLFLMTGHPVTDPDPAIFESGIHLASYCFQRQFPAVKTTDYRMAIWLQPWLAQKGADEIVYHQEGRVTECPRSNIFMIDNEDVLCTPSADILQGVTRKKIIEVSGPLFELREGVICLEQLVSAREVFLTSTTKGILPVSRIDGQMIGNGRRGKATALLMERLEALKKNFP